MKKKKITISLIAVLALVFLFAVINANKAIGGDEHNVWGWAWSSNIGWISFNSNNPGSGGGSYGVDIDTDGNLTGHAWSPHIGWIDFDASPYTGESYPGLPQHSARIDLTDSENRMITGWARACNGTVGKDCASASASDWDGWILIGDGSDSNYVWLDDTDPVTPQFRGWAWGSVVLGWISFNCLDGGNCLDSSYKVETSFSFVPEPIIHDNSLKEDFDYCARTVGGKPILTHWPVYGVDDMSMSFLFTWEYEGGEIGPDVNYTIEIFKETGEKIGETATSTSSGNTGEPVEVERVLLAEELFEKFEGGGNYYWNLTVDNGTHSNVVEGKTFAIREIPKPFAVFSHTPERISTEEDVLFMSWEEENGVITEQSEVYTGSIGYSWVFGAKAEPLSANTATASVLYSDRGQKKVDLEITDGTDSCKATDYIDVRHPLPEWREITPFGRIGSLIAGVTNGAADAIKRAVGILRF